MKIEKWATNVHQIDLDCCIFEACGHLFPWKSRTKYIDVLNTLSSYSLKSIKVVVSLFREKFSKMDQIVRDSIYREGQRSLLTSFREFLAPYHLRYDGNNTTTLVFFHGFTGNNLRKPYV